MRKIYDCFLFYNELDLLDLRFKILDDVVDFFVIAESNKTFSNQDKELIFEKNKNRYSKFLHKIIHVKILDNPNEFLNYDNRVDREAIMSKKSGIFHPHEHQWGRETYQRECIARGLVGCKDDDFILISDVDEIPNPKLLPSLELNKNYCFGQRMFYYYINCLKQDAWAGTKAVPYSVLKNNPVNFIRQNKFTEITLHEGGWHFSFLGDETFIKNKIKSYSHQEFNNDFILNSIKSNIDACNDPFFRGKLRVVPLDDSFPDEVRRNLGSYKHWIK